jgi:hypothetical protein
VLPSRSQRKQLERLGEDVRKLWNHPRASNRLKQELVRVLIQEIVADVDESRNEVVLLIQWSGGHHTELRGRRALRRGKLPAAELKALLDTLRKVHTDAAIARALNREWGVQFVVVKANWFDPIFVPASRRTMPPACPV